MADQRSISTKRHILVTGFANTQPFVSRYSTSPGQSTGSSLSGASSGRNSGSSSSASRHPLTRPLSPDLPTRDALYVFSNFSSYMQSPNEGAKGVRTKDGFRDSIRLLDYARVSAGHTSGRLAKLRHCNSLCRRPKTIMYPSYTSNTDIAPPSRQLDQRLGMSMRLPLSRSRPRTTRSSKLTTVCHLPPLYEAC